MVASDSGGAHRRRPAFRLEPMRRLAGLPHYPSMLGGLVLIGFRESMSGPYLALFGIERAHLGPIALGTFLTVRGVGAVLISMLFGAWFDRRPSALPLVLSLLAGSVGYALLSTTTDFGALLFIVGVPLGMGSAAFPMIFALAKVHIADAEPTTAGRAIAVLRASYAAAWGIGPALGAVVVGTHGYDGLFWLSAVFGLLAWIPLGLGGIRAPARVRPFAPLETRLPSRAVVLAASGLTLFATANWIGTIVLPITITVDLAGDRSAVGVAASVCALLEVPVMIAIAIRPARFHGIRPMALGFLALAVFFVAVALARSVAAVIVAQALRAIGVGLVTCLGIGYLQAFMPARPGAAAALYANTFQIGNMLAGVATGLWAQAFGYHSVFWACAAMSLSGLALLIVGRRA